MRREEALQLLWENVDLKGNAVKIVDPKNGHDHELPLSETPDHEILAVSSAGFHHSPLCRE